MKNFIRIAGIVLAVLVLLFLVGPLVITIPVPSGVVPVHQLADDDSQFTEVDGIDFHYKTMGTGAPSLVLLHGFGASLYSWREVLPELAENHQVYVYDRLAFGLTERPTEWEGENPYRRSAAVDHLEDLLTDWDSGEAILVGNSAGGTVAIEYALRRPDNVQALILVSPGISEGSSPYSRYQWLINTPQMQRIGPLLVRSIQKSGLAIIDQAWHDPSRQPKDTVPLYTKPLQAENWDFALWKYSTAGEGTNLSGRLGELTLPVLVITGDDDRIIPTRQTIENAGKIPGAELVVLPSCGHVPQEECPGAFLDAVEAFLDVINN
jgi:pimeloyl-ACP methyl ester carboxylesterase